MATFRKAVAAFGQNCTLLGNVHFAVLINIRICVGGIIVGGIQRALANLVGIAYHLACGSLITIMAVTPLHGVVVYEVIGIAITAAVYLGVNSVQALVIAFASGHDAGNQHH